MRYAAEAAGFKDAEPEGNAHAFAIGIPDFNLGRTLAPAAADSQGDNQRQPAAKGAVQSGLDQKLVLLDLGAA